MTSTAQTTADRTAATRTELAAAVRQISDLIRDWVDLRRRGLRTAGVQVAIRVGGELVFSGVSGHADRERNIALTPSHLFRIASHSKTFAATSVGILVARGSLRWDDRVRDLLPELADTGLADCTVRELVGHQAGVIRDGDDCDYWQLTRDFPDYPTLVDDLHRDGVTFGRNEHFKYSNYGYSVVGAVVEKASGVPFNEFVRTEILDVLSLPRVHPDVDGIAADELAMGHSLLLDGDDSLFVLRNPSTRAMSAATGFVANAEDLTAYGSAHVMGDERLLSDTDKRLMQRTESIVMADDAELGRYGLGMELIKVGGRSLVGHSGGFPGFVTRTFIDPKDSLVVSVLTNASRGPAHQIAVGIIKLIDLAVAKRAAVPGASTELTAAELTAAVDDLESGGDLDAGAAEVDLDAFPITVVGGFGRITLVRMGDTIVLLHPEQDDPTVEAIELSVIGPDRLLMPARPGYGSAGEPVIYRREAGVVTEVRVGGMTGWPEDVFRARRVGQMARTASSPA